jgi:hypothetical protein
LDLILIQLFGANLQRGLVKETAVVNAGLSEVNE